MITLGAIFPRAMTLHVNWGSNRGIGIGFLADIFGLAGAIHWAQDETPSDSEEATFSSDNTESEPEDEPYSQSKRTRRNRSPLSKGFKDLNLLSAVLAFFIASHLNRRKIKAIVTQKNQSKVFKNCFLSAHFVRVCSPET